jgi:4-hydroxy-4-methyl-2-oxoglutarate aldolase
MPAGASGKLEVEQPAEAGIARSDCQFETLAQLNMTSHYVSSICMKDNQSATNQALPPSQFEALRHLDACRIANAIEEFDIRLRNEGFARPGLRCLFPELPPMLGYAVTSQIRCSNPPPTGHSYPDRTDWWALMQSLPGPRVAVIHDVDPEPGLGASVGEVHARILQSLGCVGVVTNGAVRDLRSVQALGLAMFAANVSPSHAYMHMVDFGQPVEICGLRIRSGDLLFGDCHGVISIPLEIAAELPATALRQAQKEQRVIDLCGSAEFSIPRLRAELGTNDIR